MHHTIIYSIAHYTFRLRALVRDFYPVRSHTAIYNDYGTKTIFHSQSRSNRMGGLLTLSTLTSRSLSQSDEFKVGDPTATDIDSMRNTGCGLRAQMVYRTKPLFFHPSNYHILRKMRFLVPEPWHFLSRFPSRPDECHFLGRIRFPSHCLYRLLHAGHLQGYC